jgi:hypothetical protein
VAVTDLQPMARELARTDRYAFILALSFQFPLLWSGKHSPYRGVRRSSLMSITISQIPSRIWAGSDQTYSLRRTKSRP